MEIKIGENPFRPLLDREKVIEDVKNAFSKQINALEDLVNYGTNLVPRCYGSSDKGLGAVVVLAILLRQVIAMLDAVEILSSNGAVYAAGLQARALFEASAYAEWILAADTEKKATYYYVHNLRRQRWWAQRLKPGSAEATAFANDVPEILTLTNATATMAATSNLTEIDRILAQPTLAVVSQVFEQRKLRNGKDVAWHVPLGPRTVGAVAKSIGRFAEYTFFYALWSEAMHSSNYSHHVRFQKDRVIFQSIRNLSTFDTLFRQVVATTLRTYRLLLETYRSAELELGAFRRKYLENWQKALLEVPKIQYESTPAASRSSPNRA